MKKIKGFIIGLSTIGIIIVYVCLYASYIKTNDINFFVASYFCFSILKLVAIGFSTYIMVLILKSILGKNHQVVVLGCLITLILLCNRFNYMNYKNYTLNNNRISNVELLFRTLKDAISCETIEIKTDKVRLIVVPHVVRGKTTSRTRYDWYLEINNGEFVIPTEHENKARKLLYDVTYGERAKNIITVYKNSKFIKAINGVELSEDIEKINEVADKKEYRINIKVNEDNSLTYEVIGCTLEEFVNNEILLCEVSNEFNEVVSSTKVTINDRLPINLPNGEYKLCIRDKYHKQVSNTISYIKKDGVICEIEVENSK